ncbi:hypothetical protein QBC37DRAFT_207492 [Rhypophila decipiens]|uniref:Ubiquitin-like domain-containing protein n=1 Tax=Rhypophila decipiens TaxID=261697 RepID=A0AAN7B5J0_9PEZI|nr:hypothetical protein QBC37DRAFT_207492 [Rhypophila decipiens]
MTIETLRDSIQAETGHHSSAQHLYHNGHLIGENSKTLADLQIGDGEMLALHIRDMRGSTTVAGPAARQPRAPRSSSQQAPQDPEMVRLQILGNPGMRNELARTQPEMAAALDDPARFAQVYTQEVERESRARAERYRQIQELNSDPFNVENQQKIAEMIRQERVMENLQNAMEHNPEGITCSNVARFLISRQNTDHGSSFRIRAHALYRSRSEWTQIQGAGRLRGSGNHHEPRMRRGMRNHALGRQTLFRRGERCWNRQHHWPRALGPG